MQGAFVVRLRPGEKTAWQGSVSHPGRAEAQPIQSGQDLIRLIDRFMREGRQAAGEVGKA